MVKVYKTTARKSAGGSSKKVVLLSDRVLRPRSRSPRALSTTPTTPTTTPSTPTLVVPSSLPVVEVSMEDEEMKSAGPQTDDVRYVHWNCILVKLNNSPVVCSMF